MLAALLKHIRKAGVITALFAFFVTFSPSLEALACASDGCGVACSEQGQTTASPSDPSDQTPDKCADQNCIWSASHCCHPGALPAFAEVDHLPILADQAGSPVSEPLVAADPIRLDRPPRA